MDATERADQGLAGTETTSVNPPEPIDAQMQRSRLAVAVSAWDVEMAIPDDLSCLASPDELASMREARAWRQAQWRRVYFALYRLMQPGDRFEYGGLLFHRCVEQIFIQPIPIEREQAA